MFGKAPKVAFCDSTIDSQHGWRMVAQSAMMIIVEVVAKEEEVVHEMITM